MPPQDLESSLLSGRGFSADGDDAANGDAKRTHPEDRQQHQRQVEDGSDDEDDTGDDAELNTDDELGSDLSETERPSSKTPKALGGYSVQQGLEAGGRRGAGFQRTHQTGVKGVIGDAAEASGLAKAMRRQVQDEERERVMQRAMVGMTIEEEERVKRREKKEADKGDEEVERWRRQRREEMARSRSRTEAVVGGGGGRLRTVNALEFVEVLDRTNGWVVVLLSEPDLPRCEPIARRLEDLDAAIDGERYQGAPDQRPMFVRARATDLEFSLLPAASGHRDEVSDDEDESPGGRRSDPDVLPTILCYRSGQLVRSFVRVDLEDGVGRDGRGLEEVLRRSGVLTASNKGLGRSRGDENQEDV